MTGYASGGRLAMAAVAVLATAGAVAVPAAGEAELGWSVEYAQQCSKQLAIDDGAALAATERRRCMIAVATTYIELEQNSLPPEKMLLADDVSRHLMGTPPDHRPGNRARIMADGSHEVIGAIRRRQWTVDGKYAWILYDGYLKAKPDAPNFHVAERFTIENGLIREILVAGVKAPNSKLGECIE